MIKNKIKLLDCTLRDGGYYNNWFFKKELINEYLKVMGMLKIDYVEIGFRFLDKIKTKGECAYSDETFLRTLKIPKNLKIGIMINASDFVGQKNILELAEKNFINKQKSIISFIRIACHHHEVKEVMPLVNWLKKKGYEICVNIMQIPELSSNEIKNTVNEVKKSKADVLYFADSMGSLDSDKTKKIIKQIKSVWKKSTGIHTHDNMGKALENSLVAINNSVNWIDCTVTGMGRGPGNTKTEHLVLELNRKNNNLINLFNLIKKYFEPLKKKYRWGSNPFYYFAGLNSIHPTFVQEMLSDDLFDNEDIYYNLKYLSSVGGKKYSKELITLGKNYYKKTSMGEWEPISVLKNREVLIIGPGESVIKHKLKLLKFIKKNKPIVLILNAINPIPIKYVYANVVCHTLRLLSDISKYKKSKKYLIAPFSSFSKNIKSRISAKKMLNFGLQVKNNKFKFEKNRVVLPNSLAITYTLGICTSGKCKKIIFAGLDGYNKDNPKKFEMDAVLQNYKLEKNARQIFSLTPTNYDIKMMNI